MVFAGILIYLGLSYLVAAKIGKPKRVGFAKTFIFCLLFSPFIGFLIAESSAQANPRGCKWCGNKDNEAEYCGLCGKNENGDKSPYFKER